MKRRKFIGVGTTFMAALALPKVLRSQTCTGLTEEDRYLDGPFHKDNAPNRVNLASEFEPGQRIRIQGIVSHCRGPMEGINLDIWGATASGCYESFLGCPDLPNHPDAFRLRGQMRTDVEGKYSFETVLPGAYLNGAKYRPRHIHIIITLPYPILTPQLGDTNRLITQLYFTGDPYIAGDYAADHPSAANRIIPLDKTTPSLWQGTWNILIPDVTTGLEPISHHPSLTEFDVIMQKRGDIILFQIPSNTDNQPVELRLFSVSGELLKRSLHSKSQVELVLTGLSPGAYLVELGWWTGNGFHKESVPVRI